MQSSKTPYGWMALGGLLCLLGIGLACKMRDGSQARAQADAPPQSVPSIPVVPLPAPASEERIEPAKAPVSTREELPSLPEIREPRSPLSGMPCITIPTAPPGATQFPTVSGPPEIKKVDFKEGVPSALPLPPVSDQRGVADPSTPQSVSPPLGLVEISDPSKPLMSAMEVQNPKKPITPAVNVTVPAVDLSVTPVKAEVRSSEPGEPPLAPAPGPVQMYQVRQSQETLRDIARRTLGDGERWEEIRKLNPSLKVDVALVSGAFVRLPSDACVPPEEVSDVKPLPLLGADNGPSKPKVLQPLTGTYPCNLDGKRLIALPRAMRDQLGDGDTVLVSPGPDHCLWVTTQDHLERLAKRMEASQAREHEVRGFRRLYFAQTEKLNLSTEGRILIPERLAQFAGLHQEVVLIGIDDHFELWDVARWRQYTQTRSAAARSAMSED